LFDEENLVSCAGLVPVMALAERAGLSRLIAERVRVASTRVASAGVNPAGKLTSVVAGMAASADSIDDLQVVRSGGMKRLFGEVYAPATLGQFLREFTHGHVGQLAAVARAHLVGLAERTELLPGIEQRAFVDIDSLLRPVYGHAKQGAGFGHTKIAGKQVLRKGLSPLATTISTGRAAPVLAGIRLRGGKAGSGKGAASMVTEAARSPAPSVRPATSWSGVTRPSVSGRWSTPAWVPASSSPWCWPRTPRSPPRSEASRPTPGRRCTTPGAVVDPDTGELLSDAEVAETTFTAFGSTKHPVTARLVVRRVRDQARLEELFPGWRYHPFFTNTDEPTVDADLTHRRHAVIETVFADLIDGPLAHLPSGRFAANSAWAVCATITHNLLRAADALDPHQPGVSRGATLRRQIVHVPARLARPQRRPVPHLPAHWPWADRWLSIWNGVFGQAKAPPQPA
jgi:hypothetical protein